MFHCLDEQINRSRGRTATIWNRMPVVTGAIVGGLYFGILVLE